jgi:hypothetical protein
VKEVVDKPVPEHRPGYACVHCSPAFHPNQSRVEAISQGGSYRRASSSGRNASLRRTEEANARRCRRSHSSCSPVNTVPPRQTIRWRNSDFHPRFWALIKSPAAPRPDVSRAPAHPTPPSKPSPVPGAQPPAPGGRAERRQGGRC